MNETGLEQRLAKVEETVGWLIAGVDNLRDTVLAMQAKPPGKQRAPTETWEQFKEGVLEHLALLPKVRGVFPKVSTLHVSHYKKCQRYDKTVEALLWELEVEGRITMFTDGHGLALYAVATPKGLTEALTPELQFKLQLQNLTPVAAKRTT